MKKVLVSILLILCLFITGCNNNSNNLNLEELSFIEKLDYDDNYTSHIESEDFIKLAYASDDLLVYYYNNTEDNDIPDYMLKVVSEDSVESYSIGRTLKNGYLGYDESHHTVYYIDNIEGNSEHAGDATEDEVIEHDLPAIYMTKSYIFFEDGVYDFYGNSYHTGNDYERLVFFSFFIDEEQVFYSYDDRGSVLYGYNLTTDETYEDITLKDDIELRSVLYLSRDYSLVETGYGDFVSLDKEGNLNYFLRAEHDIEGYTPSIHNGLNKYGYPYITYSEIDGNDKKYLVSDDSLTNFALVDDIMYLVYMDKDIYVLLENDTYNIYNDEGNVSYSYEKPENTSGLSFRNYEQYLIVIDYNNENISIYDKESNISIESIEGFPFYHADSTYAYIPEENDHMIVFYHMDTDTETSLEVKDLDDKTLYFINSEYFILYDDLDVTLYNTDTLESTTMEYVSKLTYTLQNGTERVYGLLVLFEGEYYLIG